VAIRRDNMRRYKIGDVARILGISTDLLRYYEKKGVVMPIKDRRNDYRYYDAWDINFLMDCLWFKNFGFSIEQIADMVRIPSSDDIANMFEDKERELLRTIRRCQLLLRRSQQHREEISRIEDMLLKCEIAASPEVVRYINRVGDEYPMDENLEPLARQWLEAMPFNHRYFEISREALLSGGDGGYQWGFCLRMDYARELDFAISPPVKKIPSRRSIHTVFKSRGKGGFSPRLLQYAVDYAKEEGLTIAGDAHGVLLASIQEDDSLCGYFEAWIPIED
jgi:DNA-binding transcriptional MerR regulator